MASSSETRIVRVAEPREDITLRPISTAPTPNQWQAYYGESAISAKVVEVSKLR